MTLRKLFRLALLASASLAAMAVPSMADPIITPLIAAAAWLGGGTLAASATLAGLQLAAGIGLSLLSNALTGSPSGMGGSQSDVRVGGAEPRQVAFGHVLTAGRFIYYKGVGKKNSFIHMVFALADWECEELTAVWVDGIKRGLTTVASVGSEHIRYEVNGIVKGGVKLIKIRFFRGTMAQTADTELITASGDTNGGGMGPWTADFRAAGVCYASVQMDYDEDVLPAVPDLQFELKGARLYDLRLDSTNGGSGAQRWSNPLTWAYSANPAICDYNFRRGFFRNGIRVQGMGLPDTDLINATYISSANVCDEALTEDGSPEKRYAVGLISNDDAEWRVPIDSFKTAMAADVIEADGYFGVLAGAAYSTVMTVTDDDMKAGAVSIFSRKGPRSELWNAVAPTWMNPAFGWADDGLKTITNATYETEDGGERIVKDVALPMVSKPYQARRIANIVLEQGRMQATHAGIYPAPFSALHPGDWVTRVFNRDGFGTYLMKVTNIREVEPEWYEISFKQCAVGNYTPPGGTITLPGTIVHTPPNKAPGQPLSLTASGAQYQIVELEWVAADDRDFDLMEVWESASNSFGAALKIASVRTTRYVRSNVPVGLNRYYWIIAVDRNGNKSTKFPTSSAAGVLGKSGGLSGSTSDVLPLETIFGLVQDDVLTDGGTAGVDLPIAVSGATWLNVFGTARLTPTGVDYSLECRYLSLVSHFIVGTYPRLQGMAWAPARCWVDSNGQTNTNYYCTIDADGKLYEQTSQVTGSFRNFIAAFLNGPDADPLFKGVYNQSNTFVWKNMLLGGLRRIRVPDTVQVAGTPTVVTGMRVWAWGAAGQKGSDALPGGPGGYTKADHAVLAGEMLSILVGGHTGDGFGGCSPFYADSTSGVMFTDRDNLAGGGSFIWRGAARRSTLLQVAGGGGSGSQTRGGCGGSTAFGGGNGVGGTLMNRCVGETSIDSRGAGSGGGGHQGGGLFTSVGKAGKGGTNFIATAATSTTNAASAEDVNGKATTVTPPGTGEAVYTANATNDRGRNDVGVASGSGGVAGPGMIVIQWLT